MGRKEGEEEEGKRRRRVEERRTGDKHRGDISI